MMPQADVKALYDGLQRSSVRELQETDGRQNREVRAVSGQDTGRGVAERRRTTILQDATENGWLQSGDGLRSESVEKTGQEVDSNISKNGLAEGAADIQEQSRDYLSEDKEYSYEWFVQKADMNITETTRNVPNSRAEVIALAKKNAAEVGRESEDGTVYVHVNDIDADVVVTTKGLRHGLDRRFAELAPVTMKAGEILQNSIRINELTPKKENVAESYVLIGVAKNEDGELYIVQSVVNRYNLELMSMDVLYAINAKREVGSEMKKEESAVLNDQDGQHKGSNPSDSSVISIAQLLDFVNKYFPDILPKDVYEHYGHTERPSGELGEHAQYQERVRALDDREVLEYAADKLNTKGLTPGESNALEMFKARLAKLRGLEAQKAATEKRYKELKEAGNGEGAKEAYATVANYKRQIRNAAAQLLKVEGTEVMKRILKEARDIVEEEEQIRGREKLERYRTARMESADRKKYRERIRKDATTLTSIRCLVYAEHLRFRLITKRTRLFWQTSKECYYQVRSGEVLKL